jgi:hypothetical protein
MVMILNFDTYKETPQGKYYNGFFYKSKWNSLIWINGEPYKHRVETIIFNNNMSTIFLYKNDTNYKFPGGCIDLKKSKTQQAIDECKEEGKLLIRSIKYVGTYIQKYDNINLKQYEDQIPVVPIGQMVDVFVAKFQSFHHKHVFTQLKDNDLIEHGKFYNISEIYDILYEGHRKIIDLFVIHEDNTIINEVSV